VQGVLNPQLDDGMIPQPDTLIDVGPPVVGRVRLQHAGEERTAAPDAIRGGSIFDRLRALDQIGPDGRRDGRLG
jgi:hypothetical protein